MDNTLSQTLLFRRNNSGESRCHTAQELKVRKSTILLCNIHYLFLPEYFRWVIWTHFPLLLHLQESQDRFRPCHQKDGIHRRLRFLQQIYMVTSVGRNNCAGIRHRGASVPTHTRYTQRSLTLLSTFHFARGSV